jgi:methylated-DNA-[protein]-cysteine S-methyltransferase
MRELTRTSDAVPVRSVASRLSDYAAVIATPWPGLKLGISTDDRAITSIDYLPGDTEELRARSPLAAEALRQLRRYFRDARHVFTLPLAPAGSEYQRRVWSALRRIPAGTTLSYGTLAARLGSSARAIGGACRANPISLVIPCHRVVSRNGLGGFMGATAGRSLDIKQWLLAHESAS